VGGKSFKSKKKKKNWVGAGEKIKLQQKTEIIGSGISKPSKNC
jgi:hypothetical protein